MTASGSLVSVLLLGWPWRNPALIRGGKRKDQNTFFLWHEGQLLSSEPMHKENYISKKSRFTLFISQLNKF